MYMYMHDDAYLPSIDRPANQLGHFTIFDLLSANFTSCQYFYRPIFIVLLHSLSIPSRNISNLIYLNNSLRSLSLSYAITSHPSITPCSLTRPFLTVHYSSFAEKYFCRSLNYCCGLVWCYLVLYYTIYCRSSIGHSLPYLSFSCRCSRCVEL
jgi:hypothetical protein